VVRRACVVHRQLLAARSWQLAADHVVSMRDINPSHHLVGVVYLYPKRLAGSFRGHWLSALRRSASVFISKAFAISSRARLGVCCPWYRLRQPPLVRRMGARLERPLGGFEAFRPEIRLKSDARTYWGGPREGCGEALAPIRHT
jgi:hypothetical protein